MSASLGDSVEGRTVARTDEASFAGRLDAVQIVLTQVWRELLERERIDIDDNFFSLGGHSLLAMRAVLRLQAVCGIRIPVSAIFEHPTIASLSRVVCEQSQEDAAPLQCSRDTGTDTGVTSRAQRGLWFQEQLGSNGGAYVLPEVWRICGPLQRESLRTSLTMLVARHQALRTRFVVAGDLPVRVIDEPRPVDLQIVDLRQLSGSMRQSEVDRLVFEEASRPFDLSRDLLLRTKLAVLEHEHQILFVTTHHIASDARSQQILRHEIGAVYGQLVRQEQPQIDAPQTHSVDQVRLSPSRERELREYWRAQLQDLPPLELPSDCERPACFSYRGTEHRFSIPADLTARLRRLAGEHRVTLQIVLLAAYQVLLARLSGQTDFGVATPVAETRSDESDGLMGLFVNVLITRADLSGDPDFAELLARVRRSWLSGYDHCDLPFDAVVAELLPSRDVGRAPLAQAMFQFVPFDDGVPNLEGLHVTRVRYPSRCVQFDLELSVWNDGAGLRAALGYSTDMFESSAGARLAGYYLTLLESVVAHPYRDVSKLPILGLAEQKQQLVVWSGASDFTPVNADDCVHRQFALQAAQTSELTAVAFGETKLTYRQLDERANQLAHYLLELGVQHEEPVGIHLERSPETVIATLAVLKADAAYVPLDVRQPEERLAFMAADAGVRTLITDRTLPPAMQHRGQRIIGVGKNAAWATQPISPPRSDARPLDLAYIMYTSGSTGRPKGVAVTHQAVVRLVRNTNYVQLTPRDRVAQGANTSFDAATFEIWGALLNGARLVSVATEKLLSPPELGRAFAGGEITTLFLTPALFSQLAAEDAAIFAPLRYLVIGGDVLDPGSVRRILAAGAPQHLINGYGPTENTTFSVCFDCAGAGGSLASIPIGRPVTNSTCYVLDRHGALLPQGAAGELFVGGKGLARGYIGRPELTAERFVAHPFSPGERLYRTGDRARWRSDSTLAFRGRIDRQIKLRGHRIEPGEIECALKEHEAVAQAMVIAQDRAEERRLIAYWTPRTECGSASAEALSAHLHRFLPDYMIPAQFVQLPAFPLTANGKIDVSALPAPRGAPMKAPKESLSALEAQIAGIWRSVLNDGGAGVHDNFFTSGGSSLLAVQAAARLRDKLGCPVSIGDLFSFPTIAGLARAIEARSQAGGASGRLMVIRQGDRKPPIIFPPDIRGDVMVFDGIRAAMPPDQPVFALEDRSDNPRARSMEAMAAEYCKAVRLRWPHDMIHLAGYSFSGILAYEMARQLIADGHPVGLLAIIDTGPSHLSRDGAIGPGGALWAFMRNVPRWIDEDLIRASWDEAPARLRRSTRKWVKLLRRGRSKFGPSAADLFDVTGWSESQRAQADFNLRALESFMYRPYPERLMLFRASTRPLFQSLTRDLGWGAIASEMKIVHIPGNHETITRSPRVEILSAALNAALEECAGAAEPVYEPGDRCECA